MEQYLKILILLIIAIFFAGTMIFLYENNIQEQKLEDLSISLAETKSEMNKVELKLVNSTPTSEIRQLKEQISSLETKLEAVESSKIESSTMITQIPNKKITQQYNRTQSPIIHKNKDNNKSPYLVYNNTANKKHHAYPLNNTKRLIYYRNNTIIRG